MKLFIFTALVPLSLAYFLKKEKVAKGLQLLASALGVGGLIASEALKPEVPALLPTVVLLVIYLIEKIKDKKFDVYELLGVLMAGQALLLGQSGAVIALAIAADLFFCFTEKNSRKYFYLAMGWLPIICGKLINEKSELLDVLLAATIILRSFEWPLKIAPGSDGSVIQSFISRIIIPVALWKSVEITMAPFWIGFWMSMPLFFAWGASSRVVLMLTSLSLWTVSPLYGLISVALWPAFFLEGAALILFAAMVTFVGTLANIQNLGLKEEIMWGIVGLEAFVISRVIASLFLEKKKQSTKESVGLVMLSLSALVAAMSFIPIESIPWQSSGYVFAGLVVVLSLAGYFLLQKKKKLFNELESLAPMETLADWIETTRFYNYKSTPQTKFYENPWITKMFEAIESEGYVIILLSLIAGFFLWSSP